MKLCYNIRCLLRNVSLYGKICDDMQHTYFITIDLSYEINFMYKRG